MKCLFVIYFVSVRYKLCTNEYPILVTEIPFYVRRCGRTLLQKPQKQLFEAGGKGAVEMSNRAQQSAGKCRSVGSQQVENGQSVAADWLETQMRRILVAAASASRFPPGNSFITAPTGREAAIPSLSPRNPITQVMCNQLSVILATLLHNIVRSGDTAEA